MDPTSATDHVAALEAIHDVPRRILQIAGHEADGDRGQNQAAAEQDEQDAQQLLAQDEHRLPVGECPVDAPAHCAKEAKGAPQQEDDAHQRDAAARRDGRIDHLFDQIGVDGRVLREPGQDDAAGFPLTYESGQQHRAQQQDVDEGQNREVRHRAGVVQPVVVQQAHDRCAGHPRQPVALQPAIDRGRDAGAEGDDAIEHGAGGLHLGTPSATG